MHLHTWLVKAEKDKSLKGAETAACPASHGTFHSLLKPSPPEQVHTEQKQAIAINEISISSQTL